MKLKISHNCWWNIPWREAKERIDFILGEDSYDEIYVQNLRDKSKNLIVENLTLDEFEIQLLVLKHPDLFEIYYEDHAST